MKKELFLTSFLFVILFPLFVFSQSGWIQLNSGVSKNLNSVFFPPSAAGSFGFAVGDSGVVLKTTTGGVNWISVSPNAVADFKALFFLDLSTGWVTGWGNNYVLVYKTTNSGANWTRQYNEYDILNAPTCCSFINANTGYIGCGRKTALVPQGFDMSTINGGVNWTKSSHYEKVLCCAFASPGNGWRGGIFQIGYLSAALSYTENYGANWNQTYFVDSTYFFGIQFIDSLNGFCIANSFMTPPYNFNYLLETTSGGYSWGKKSELKVLNKLTPSNFFFSLYFVTAQKGWLCGTNGNIYFTPDGGNSWSTQNSHVTTDLKAIKFTDAYTGYCVGSGGVILKTVTGGITNVNIQSEIPKKYFLSQNIPNPFNPVTIIKYSVPKNTLVTIQVFDILGRLISTLINKVQLPGDYETTFNGSGLNSGIYFYRLQSSGYIETRKMLLLK